MHAHDELIRESEICFAVMGRDGRFSLFEITAPKPLDEELVSAVVANGYSYCGVVGLSGGLVLTRHEPDPDSWITVAHAARAAALAIGDRLRGKCDTSDWLELLYALPDRRESTSMV